MVLTIIVTIWFIGNPILSSPSPDPDNPDILEIACSSLLREPSSYSDRLSQMRDILPNICQHLNIRDHCSFQRACTEFLYSSRRILAKGSPQLLPVKIAKKFGDQPAVPHIANTINIRPRKVLIFAQNIEPKEFYGFVADEALAHYTSELPPDCETIVIQGLSTIIDKQPLLTTDNDAAGLFLPESPGTVELRSHGLRELSHMSTFTMNNLIENMFNTLVPKIREPEFQDHHFGLMLLSLQQHSMVMSRSSGRGYSHRAIIERLKEMLRSRSHKFAIWGGNVEWVTSQQLNPSTIFGISLFGAKVQTWSLVIDSTSPKESIRQKIQDFKQVIHVSGKKSVALGLLSISRESDADIVMKHRLFQKAFLGLRFFSFGMRADYPKYCADSTLDNGENEPIEYSEDYMCYLVITYL